MSPSTNAIATSPLAVEEFSDSPITWRQANKYIQTGRLSSLLRSRQQLQRYDYWIQDCLGRYHSVGDYIKHIVLGWPVSWVTDDSVPAGPTAVLSNNAADPNPRQRLRAYLPSGGNCNASDEETIQIVLRQNDFPYNFHQDVIHYVLWSNRDNLDSQFVERYVGEAFPRQRHQWLWFCNPSSRKSIKDVWHVHILLHNP
jgi:hypothetical protein